MKRELYNISVLLMKKAYTINELIEKHLDYGLNNYNLNQFFFELIKKDKLYNDIKNVFKNDKK